MLYIFSTNIEHGRRFLIYSTQIISGDSNELLIKLYSTKPMSKKRTSDNFPLKLLSIYETRLLDRQGIASLEVKHASDFNSNNLSLCISLDSPS